VCREGVSYPPIEIYAPFGSKFLAITLNRRQQLFAAKLSIQTQLKILYLEVSGRSSSLLQYYGMMPTNSKYNLDSGETLHTLPKQQAYLLPESFGFL